jgi:hypothetical protein
VTLTQVEHVAVVLAVASLLGVSIWIGLVVVRLRRRWRRRQTLLQRIVQRPLAFIPVSRVSESVTSTVGSPSWWVVQRDRHRMWRSVAAARRAVSVAARADAPVGDLPVLTRQLQQAAVGVDAALRASGGERRLTREATADRVRIERAASDIHAAAMASLGAMRPDVQPVVSAISVEVTALAAGIQAARSTA